MFSAFLESLSYVETLFLIGVAGALIMLPLKDIISVAFYDICDVFLSLMAAALLFASKGITEPSPENILIAMLLMSVGIVFIKLFVVVPFQKRGENSSVLSMNDYIGMTGTISISVTQTGIGEVVFATPFGHRNQMAKIHQSEQTEMIARIPVGSEVQIMSITDSILYVAPITKQEEVG